MKEIMMIWYIIFKILLLKKKFNDFDNGIKRFRKIKSGDLNLNIFKKNLNEISKGRFRSKEQKSALENNKLLYK